MDTHIIQHTGVNGPIRRSVFALIVVYLALFGAALLIATYAIDRDSSMGRNSHGPALPYVASSIQGPFVREHA